MVQSAGLTGACAATILLGAPKLVGAGNPLAAGLQVQLANQRSTVIEIR